jgi:hypothetical protein
MPPLKMKTPGEQARRQDETGRNGMTKKSVRQATGARKPLDESEIERLAADEIERALSEDAEAALEEQIEREAEAELERQQEWLERTAVDGANDAQPRASCSSYPTIKLSPNLADVVDEAVSALAARARELGVYQRGHELVHVSAISLEEAEASRVVSTDGDGQRRRELVAGTPTIFPLAPATLREVLTRVARFEKFDARATTKGKRWKHCIPGDPVVHAVHARRKWVGVPGIVGIAESPFMRADGSICQTAGFDPASGWLYAPSCEFAPVPEHPTQLDAHRAYKLVDEVFHDFPFQPSAHRSVPIAAALTELLRPAIDGCTPAFVFNGNHRGVGKSLLTDTISNITTGRDMPRRSCPRHEDEVEKVVGAYAMQGAAHFSLDNVTGDFGGPTIDAVLSTPGDWEPRVLGKSKIPSVPWRTVVYVTGHHFGFAEETDTCDRVLMAYLQTDLENPRTRSGFQHPQLRKWTRENRGTLVCALLTMARAWFVAGRPAQRDCPNWGTYDEWAAVVPNIIVFAGGPSPMTARVKNEIAVSDSQRAMACVLETWPKLQKLVAATETAQWKRRVADAERKREPAPKAPPKRTGLTLAELRHALYDEGQGGAAQGQHETAFDSMREALATLCCTRQQAGRVVPTAHAMSKKLGKKKGTNIGGKRLVNELNRDKVAVWWVEDVTPQGAGVAGVAGVGRSRSPQHAKNGKARPGTASDSFGGGAQSTPATPATPASGEAAE